MFGIDEAKQGCIGSTWLEALLLSKDGLDARRPHRETAVSVLYQFACVLLMIAIQALQS